MAKNKRIDLIKQELDLYLATWKPIENFEGLYEVSDQGEIRSKDRLVTSGHGKRTVKGQPIKPRVDKDGYLMVCLWKEGKCKSFSVHRLVAEAFIPNPNNLPQVNHKNGKKKDCAKSNLEWSTAKDNINHAYAHGLSKGHSSGIKGAKHGMSKLKDSDVVKIKKLLKSYTLQCIASQYNVSISTISAIKSGRHWSHI